MKVKTYTLPIKYDEINRAAYEVWERNKAKIIRGKIRECL